MPVPIGIDLQVPEALGTLLSRRKRGNLLKQVYLAIGDRWGSEYLPKHFTGEQKKYDYAPRSGEGAGVTGKKFWRSYTGRKKKKYGHTLALVYTGESRRRARAYRVAATRNGAKVTVPAPALNFRNPHTNIDMVSELRQVTPDEQRNLAAYGTRLLARTLRSLTGRTQKRIS
ncbi:MAG: hypothetical protein GX616_03570 [Planctomycetes bacterium]|nr:hypothetical protein [Planctomycetota bacterium]